MPASGQEPTCPSAFPLTFSRFRSTPPRRRRQPNPSSNLAEPRFRSTPPRRRRRRYYYSNEKEGEIPPIPRTDAALGILRLEPKGSTTHVDMKYAESPCANLPGNPAPMSVRVASEEHGSVQKSE